MADTKRNLDAFLNVSTGLLKDNTAGDISVQDLRDQVFSNWYPTIIAKSTNYTATHGDLVVVTTAGSDVTITLPASPAADDRIAINYRAKTGTEKVIIGRNAKKIAGVAADYNLYSADNTNGLHDNVVLQYDLTNGDWIVFAGSRGKVVQMVYATNTTVLSTSAVIPVDDTIPQSTEGVEYLTLAITPKSANNILVIDFVAWGQTNGYVTTALFKDSGADAIQVTTVYATGTPRSKPLVLRCIVSAGSTAEATYRIRFGPNNGTGYLLQDNSSSLFSTADKATLSITEFTP